MTRVRVLCLLLALGLLAACAQHSFGPEGDAAFAAYKARLAADPAHRETCEVDGVAMTLPRGWFEVPLGPGASPLIKHFYIHSERLAHDAMLPTVREFLNPKAAADALFAGPEAYETLVEENIPGYDNASVDYDAENRVIRHVYRCLAPELGGRPVFRCVTLAAGATGAVEVQYTDALENLANVQTYYLDVEELMGSIVRR
jgi:hypothetical protein